ncbi:3397_t:CDS:2 [Ambispora gerdemannii]|uniref:3397_t:CDS:1 n=1 Tax=Ambispora gerdemannii TaxID=144530 RepID=A0A9N8VC46_9GLOM|nr:3397_t:CDS:2 [Ambispora gerdemannii]
MIELYVWGACWDLPSVDSGCLAVITYLQIFAADDWGLIKCNNPALSPTGELPLLKDGTEWFAGLENIIKYLKKKEINGEQHLTVKQKAESLAFLSLLQDTIYNALLFSWYGDLKNFVQVIRPMYGKLLPLSVRYILPIQMRNVAEARLEKYGAFESLHEVDENHKIYQIARRSYKALSEKLGEKDYFFGSSPTTLDAIVYGYLALHLYPELPSPILSVILKTEYSGLSRFCDRMKSSQILQTPLKILPDFSLPSLFTGFLLSRRIWFINRYWKPVKSDKSKVEKSPAQIDFERKRTIAICGAIIFMTVYVIWNGIITIEIVADSKKEEEIENRHEDNADGSENDDFDDDDFDDDDFDDEFDV